jgi:hypothetical protein
MNPKWISILAITACLICINTAQAAEGERKIGQYSGFEGQEELLGAAVADAIAQASPTGSEQHDFSDQEKTLGLAVGTAIKTINVSTGYTHEMNDALVKMTLTYIQFAKDRNLMSEVIDEEVRIQFPMLTRIRKVIESTDNQELALIAVTEQTSCFYQLVPETLREPGKLTYKSPFGNVLAATRRMGQHDLTEEEIHNIWTVPRLKRSAEVLGVDLQISEWQDDGMITISLPVNQAVANH